MSRRKPQRIMMIITTKLKRIKYLRITCSIISLPFRLPLWVLYMLGECAEKIDSLIGDVYSKFEYYVVDKLKWNDVAKKQREKNPDKFK